MRGWSDNMQRMLYFLCYVDANTACRPNDGRQECVARGFESTLLDGEVEVFELIVSELLEDLCK